MSYRTPHKTDIITIPSRKFFPYYVAGNPVLEPIELTIRKTVVLQPDLVEASVSDPDPAF
jgi:hypothetical protein